MIIFDINSNSYHHHRHKLDQHCNVVTLLLLLMLSMLVCNGNVDLVVAIEIVVGTVQACLRRVCNVTNLYNM